MKDISPELRWQIASRFASLLPVVSTTVLPMRLGDAYHDHLVEEIWCHMGSEASEIARCLDLPISPADQLAGSLLEILQTVYGREFRGEILDLTPVRAVLLISRCPLLLRAMEMGEHSSAFFHPCLAFCVSATGALHNEYSVQFIRAMCDGDKTCEMRIAKREELEKAER
jgi:hypothetical protein